MAVIDDHALVEVALSRQEGLGQTHAGEDERDQRTREERHPAHPPPG
jgi:hypothetical protein